MRLSQRLSLNQINEFLPPYPGDAVLKTQDDAKLYRSADADALIAAADSGSDAVENATSYVRLIE